jgi:lipopolysaccharide biosynthesis glycosyltransferase
VDILILGDLAPLIEIELDRPIAAVPAYPSNVNNSTFANFNAGVLLMDCEYWRTHNTREALEIFMKESFNLNTNDQDAMNYVFRNKWMPLSYDFNLTVKKFETSKAIQLRMTPKIVHFVGRDKPWTRKGKSRYHLIWRIQNPNFCPKFNATTWKLPLHQLARYFEKSFRNSIYKDIIPVYVKNVVMKLILKI